MANDHEHDRMVNILYRDKSILGKALNLPKIWIRSKEFIIDYITGERADIVFQNDFDAFKGNTDFRCYAVEVKSDEMDHEGIGQLDKYIYALTKTGEATKHWGPVFGVAIAKRYTTSGLRLLLNAGHIPLLWSEINSTITLRDIIPRKAIPR